MSPANTSATGGRTHVYRMSVWIRVLSIAFFVFTILGFFGLLWRQTPGLAGRNPGELLEWAAMVAFALGWMVYVYTASIVLTEDKIEKRTPLKTANLREARM